MDRIDWSCSAAIERKYGKRVDKMDPIEVRRGSSVVAIHFIESIMVVSGWEEEPRMLGRMPKEVQQHD